jgi:hypothetical protein
VFENRVLRRIFGPKREEVTGDWRKLHNEELHNLYSPDIRIIKSRMKRWARNEARMEDVRKFSVFWFESLKGIDHSEFLGADRILY